VPREKRVLFVGRLLPHKGIDHLIKAVDNTMELRIIGRAYDPLYFGYLNWLAQGKNVTFKTELDDAELPGEYASATVTVLPSVYRSDNGDVYQQPELLGLTLLESMACGTPAICSDVGAMPEVVQDGLTGFVVPPSDPVRLGDKLRLLLADPEQAARLGEAGRQRVLDYFTWDKTAERCLQAYAELAPGFAKN